MPSSNSQLRDPSRLDLWICCLFVAAFCYELPLIEITSYDRLNPRLVDVMTVVAFFFTSWKRNKSNKLLRAWELLTIVFVLAALISFAALLPINYGYFSIFFAIKYIETLVGLYILTGFNWQNHHIDKLLRFFCYGIIFAGAWGLLQLLGVIPTERYLPNGELVVVPPGIVLASFGVTYFHSGVMGALGCGVALLLLERKAIFFPMFLLALAASLFLATFSGSRGALAMAIIIITIMVIRNRRLLLFACIAGIIAATSGVATLVEDYSATSARLESSTEKNSVTQRLGADYFDLFGETINYHGIKLLLVGGGFYAVPMPDGNGDPKYRVSYGFHNIYFFAIEQAGLLAFFAMLSFFYLSIKHAVRNRKNSYATCGLAIIIGIMLIGWTGQIFLHGFGTENMITLQVFLIILLSSMSKQDPKRYKKIIQRSPPSITKV